MIELINVTKTYPGLDAPVYQDFSVRIEKGELVLLTGESGSGKSTLISMLMLANRDYCGEIRVMGQNLAEIKAKEIPYYRRKIGVMLQDASLMKNKTVYENVELARTVVGANLRENRRVITSLFSLLGISHLHGRTPDELSGGERQKVCLARALVNYPAILLADEPTGNLSPQESKEIMQLFELIHKQGVTIVIATHDRESSAGLACREIVLSNRGRAKMNQRKELHLQAREDTLYQVLNTLEECLEQVSCPEDSKMDILIAVEEIYVNIARYAYGGVAGEVVVLLEIQEEEMGHRCAVTFRDRGKPYNPLEKEDPDITLSAEERGIGGLGIYMVKQTMDQVEYEYRDSYNILRLEKSF